MKSRIVSIVMIVFLLLGKASLMSAGGVQTDPVLTAAIVNQMNVLSKLFATRQGTQLAILGAEGTVTAAMTRIHQVEDQVLKYMSNVQGVFQNAYQIKRCAELAVEIPQNVNLVRKSIKIGKVQGTVIAATVGTELTKVYTEMASLLPLLSQLVTSGSYSYDDIDDSGKVVQKTKRVNLLDSAERYYICNEVMTKLENINTGLYLLAWEIQTMRWRDLLYGLDPDGWIAYMSGQNIVNGLISDWKYNLKYW